MHIDHPFHFDKGGVATTSEGDHIRDMLEQLLLTSPGERVNRPDFGCGLLRQVFEPNSPELAAALKATIQASIQRWLGELVEAREVGVVADDSTLQVSVSYIVRRTGETKVDQFDWGRA